MKTTVSRVLSDLTDMRDCTIPDAKRRKLKGRARFSIDVVNRLTSRKSRNRLTLSGDDDEDGGTMFLVNNSLALQREHIGAVVHVRQTMLKNWQTSDFAALKILRSKKLRG